MSEKIFKNRITQETPNTIKQLKSLWIDMSSDKQLTPNTPNGLFAFILKEICCSCNLPLLWNDKKLKTILKKVVFSFQSSLYIIFSNCFSVPSQLPKVLLELLPNSLLSFCFFNLMMGRF